MNCSVKETRVEFYRRWSKSAQTYFKWQAELISGFVGDRLADIGCGLGNFAWIYKDRELYLGMDSDKDIRREISKIDLPRNFRMAAVHDICQDEAVSELRKHSVDTVICINTLEHIKDHRRALLNMLSGISQGDHVCLIVPALQCLYGTLDLFDGHYRRYSKEDLRELVRGIGAEIVHIRYMNIIGALGWFLKGKIIREKVYRTSNFTMMVKLLPLIRRFERFIEPPFGLSLVTVLKKR